MNLHIMLKKHIVVCFRVRFGVSSGSVRDGRECVGGVFCYVLVLFWHGLYMVLIGFHAVLIGFDMVLIRF